MPFVLFYIGTALLVLGFTFRVLQITHRLTEVKKGKEEKLRNIGIVGVFVGLLIALVSLGMTANERNAMIVAGLNIIAVGISTLLQHYLKPQNEKILGGAAYAVIIIGFILCMIYELANIC